MKIHFLLFFVLLLLSGCGKETEELKTYKEQMEGFFQQVQDINDGMNSIDATSPEAASDMLQYLDSLDMVILEMSQYEIPESFASIGNLAIEASENMNRAATLYHEVLESDSFDENTADAAMAYYERANLRIQYIISILHGQIPEGENITYSYESETSENE